MSELSLYLHIPFCRHKCNYCDFYSITDTGLLSAYCRSLLDELSSYHELIENSIIKSLYIGGGTPSLLPVDAILPIFKKLKLDQAEITLEANPDSLDIAKAKAFRDLGVNRLSIGVQSFMDKELKLLGRLHNAAQAEKALEIAKDNFPIVNLDLMYGLPEQTREDKFFSLRRMQKFEPQHISYYELTIYADTLLGQQKVTENNSVKPFLRGKNFLEEMGYQHYEISNYALKGYACVHNIGYWQDRAFIGLGVSADSYYLGNRSQNISSMQEYLQGQFHYQTAPAQESEYIISALRQSSGLDINVYQQKFHLDFKQKYSEALAKLKGLLLIDKGHLQLTTTGMLWANRVYREFV